MKTKLRALAALIAITSSTMAAAQAPPPPPPTPLHFAKGTSATTVSGTVKGYGGKDYKLGARAGQTMSVKLTSKNPSLYMNVLKPGGEALFNGSMSGASFSGALPETGDYVVQVYFMRNEARRGASAPFSLNVAIK